MTNPERRRLIDRIKTIEERLIVVVNPMSKRGSEKASHVRSLIRREGMNLEETSTDHPDDVGHTMEFWSKRFGGDGAINQVVNNIMLSRSNKNVVLVPMPAGTANDFCRAIKFDSVENVLEAMVDFNIRAIDIIKVEIDDGLKTQVKYCSNILGLGLDGDLAHRSQKYKRFGLPGYWYASFKKGAVVIFRGMDMYRMRVTSGDFQHEGRMIGIMMSNIDRYARTMTISPGASPDDGKIHVTLVKPMSGLKSILAAAMLTLGWHFKMKQVDGFTCDEVEVEILDDLYAQEDGEVYSYPRFTKFKLSLERQALNVLAASEISSNGSSY
jgi:diacylglycerol kinase (ATP)